MITAPAGTQTAAPSGADEAARLAPIIADLAQVTDAELTVHTGTGAAVRLPTHRILRVAPTDGDIVIGADGWTMALVASSVRRAALVEPAVDGATSPAAGTSVAYRLLDHFTQEVLRINPAASAGDGAALRRLAARHAATLSTVTVLVRRPGGDARIDPDVALALWIELVESREITFDVTNGESSAEIFPNVPLVNPHLADGFLYAGEPARRDGHLHVRLERISRVRFWERHLPDGRVWHAARFVDTHGYSLCDAWFPNPYRTVDGGRVAYDPQKEPGKTQLFRDFAARYDGTPGIEYEVECPFES